MATARYTVVPRGRWWAIAENSASDFLTREAAFEAAAGAASTAIKQGERVELIVEAPEPGPSALGTNR